MIELVMLKTVENWKKNQTIRVADDHWLVSSGYVRVVGHVDVAAELAVAHPRRPARRGRLARRSPEEVSSGADPAQLDGGSTVRADGGPQSGGDSGGPVASTDEAGGSTKSSASFRFGKA